LKNICDGDKGKRFLWNVVVTHFKLVVSVDGPFPATVNDKISVKYNEFIRGLRTHDICRNIAYKIRVGPEDAYTIDCSTCYVIVDGGYIDSPSMMSGFPGVHSDPVKYKFNDWLASVRKDVECFFGILKNRFRFFKNPINLHSDVDVNNAFHVACMLHNMILTYDGLDVLWENDVNWGTLNPADGDEVDIEEPTDSYSPVLHDDNNFTPTYVHDLIPIGDRHSFEDAEKIDLVKLRELLANHLQLQYRSGKLRWPRTRKEISSTSTLSRAIRENFPNAGDIEN
jgi:hypothetical protein